MKDPCLVCPKCQTPFQTIDPSTIVCPHNHRFKIDENVIVLAPEYVIDKKYAWNKSLRNPRANLNLDKKSLAAKSRQRLDNMLGYIVDHLPHEKLTLLDIATGRGLLLRKMLPQLKHCVLYLNDCSVDVLIGTYTLVKPLIGLNTLIPFQANATDLPLRSDSFDAAISFGPNNVKPTFKAFQEVYRVLKKGGQLIFSMSLFEKNSPSHRYLIDREGGVDNFGIIDGWQHDLSRIGFNIMEQKVLFDGKVEKVPLDVLPRENGERFQEVGVSLVK